MKQKLEVLELDAEEIPLETKIENALIKENVTEMVISELEKRYAGMKLSSLDDKDMYLQIKEAKKNVRAIGIIVEKTCKKGREDAVRTQRLWLATEKKHLDRIDKVQSPLEAEIKRFDDEVERKENEEKERKEAAFQQRQSTLIKYGAHYNNGSFDLNHISYEIDNIRESDQEIWEEIILPKYKAEFEKIEAEKVRQEKEREAAALKLKQEQDELRKQQEELREAQADLQKQKDEAEMLDRQRLENEKKAQREKETTILNNRLKQLNGITWNGITPFYHYGSVIITTQDKLLSMNEVDFEKFRDAHNELVAKELKEAEEKRIADAEKQRQADIEAALQKERERVAKEKADAEFKSEQERKKREEELAMASDKEKWSNWIMVVSQLLPPTTMKSTIYKSKVLSARVKLDEILDL